MAVSLENIQSLSWSQPWVGKVWCVYYKKKLLILKNTSRIEKQTFLCSKTLTSPHLRYLPSLRAYKLSSEYDTSDKEARSFGT